MLNLPVAPFEPLDLHAIRRDFPIPGIAAGAGVDLTRKGSEAVGLCPFHSERSPSFTVFDGGQRYHCFGCGAGGDVLDFLQALHGVGLREAGEMLVGGTLPIAQLPPLFEPSISDRLEEAVGIWEAAQPIRGTLAEAYLRSRSIDIALPDSLRFASLPYGKRGPAFPVLVAAVSNVSGRIVGIQRTFLRADGLGKADVPKPKLSLGQVAGGAVRLTPPARSMILCEGVEDALSLVQTLGRAAWAALGTCNLGRVVLPFATDDIVIGADNDEAGEAAAQKAAHAYAEQGCKVRILRPLAGHKDHNSELMGVRT